ncbi:hypothetical protein LCGC14_1719740 [marine sediment metagenome]|uniref:Lactate dehydrogenase n=1 Tax=marine sediment metagenome TaxID=412755 RepID=A0A0F9KCN4_9ZZZZ
MNILVTTHPFGSYNKEPINMLTETRWNVCYNSLGRRLKYDEVKDMLKNMDGVIAGTELYNRESIQCAPNLKVISRVGIGFDNIDLDVCKERGIRVTYTPEAPSDAVADLTVAQIINLLRGVHLSDKSIRNGKWERILGLLISEVNIGVLGVGRIGSRVVERLKPFFPKNIFTCDIHPNEYIEGVIWENKDDLFKKSDLVTIHIPLSERNRHYVSLNEMGMMKRGSYLINTSRGAILNEEDLVVCLENKHLAGAALDVFEKEPYDGILKKFDNIIFTAHIGASAKRSRFLMEKRAAEDCIRVLNNQSPLRPVVEDRY